MSDDLTEQLLDEPRIRINLKLINKLFTNKGIQQLKVIGGPKFIIDSLGIDPYKGLNDIEVFKMAELFGNNKIQEFQKQTIQEMIKEQLDNRSLQILLLASFVSLIIGLIQNGIPDGYYDSLGIFFAVFLIIFISVAINLKKQEQFSNLFKKQQSRLVPVTRNNYIIQINVDELVVGDIFQIQTGEIIPVDGILLEINGLVLDESDMTGELDPSYKSFKNDDYNPMIISGSKVQEGTGSMIVLQVGENTIMGKIKALQQQEQQKFTPLQQKLTEMADNIGQYGVYAALSTFVCMTLKMIFKKFSDNESFLSLDVLDRLTQYFMLAVSVVVMAIPEGLPFAVTLSLAYSSKKMYEEKNLIRLLSACETMGEVNNICTDKTGTLTQNNMTIQKILVQNIIHTNINQDNIDVNIQKLLCESIGYNTDANPLIYGSNFESIGNKTECALLKFMYHILKEDYRKYRQQQYTDNIIKILPFNYNTKCMVTFVKLNDLQIRVYMKGAPDYLIDNCNRYISENGSIQKIDQNYIDKILKTNNQFAKHSLRNILIAYKDINKNEQLDDNLQNFIFLAITGIKDPLRENISQSILKCQNLGIKVRMITGDNIDTAIAIAKDAKILSQSYEHTNDSNFVMEGQTFNNLVGGLTFDRNGVYDQQNFDKITKDLVVLARSSPYHKLLLVTGLQELQNIVAVTGDGTNDAPALKKADIGLAMGISGTEVAKDAADIILLDDNFDSILTAVKYGRNIFDCIKKFLQFQLTVNIVGVILIFICGLILQNPPLTVIQILWINLIMDTFGSLALATEQPSQDLIEREPYKICDELITPIMWRNIVSQCIFQIVVLFFVLILEDKLFGLNDYTLFFNTFVFLQVFNMINARILSRYQVNVFEGITQNIFFGLIFFIIVFFQIIIVQFGGKSFQCTKLSIFYHLFSIFIGMGSIPVGYLIKEIPDEIFENIVFLRAKEKISKKKEFIGRNTLQKNLMNRRMSNMQFQEI